MTELVPILGILAGVVGIADTLPYIRDTIRGTTRPHRGTWLIWAVLAVVVSFSLEADGATWSLIMPVAQAVLATLIFLLAIRNGVGGLRPIELAMMAIAGAGVAGWLVASEPLIATLCVVIADILGAAMMVLAGLVRLPRSAVAGIGLAVVAGHNLLDGISPESLGAWGPLWMVLHVRGQLGVVPVQLIYPLLPWIGVMALGYAAGPSIFSRNPETSRRVAWAGVARSSKSNETSSPSPMRRNWLRRRPTRSDCSR